MKIKFLLLISIGFSLHISAQKKKTPDSSSFIVQPDRIELEIHKSDVEFTIINGREDGLLIAKETNIRSADGFGWTLYKLDTALQQEWKIQHVVPYTYTFRGWDYSEGMYYLLFASAQYRPEEFAIVQINGDNSEVNSFNISTVFPIVLSHFEVIGNMVLFAGMTNFRPAVITFDLEERKPRVLPGIYGESSEIVDIFINDDNRTFSVAMLERLPNKTLTVVVKTFTTDNILVQNNLVNPGDRRNLIDGAPTDFSSGFQYIAGAYATKSTQFSRGLYLSKFVNGRQQFIKYYNYADLNNFFDYMNRNRKERVKERISRRKSKGKKNKFNYRLLVHEIINQGNEYIMIGEAYYPRYSSYPSMMPYGVNWANQSGRYQNIVGYKYTHAIVVSFDQKGNILWDQSFPIDDVYLPTLEELVTVNVQKNRIELLYLEDNTIRSKIIHGNEVLEGRSYTPVRLDSKEEEFSKKDPDVEGLITWYGSASIAFGEQSISNSADGRNRSKREVFYINKVRYNPGELSN